MTADLSLPRVVLGTMTFGDTVDDEGSAKILGAALDAGVRWIDTANSYSDGRSEEILGNLLGSRDDIVLATKVGQPQSEVGDASLLAPERMRTAVEGSLRRLGRERIDIVYLHKPDRSTPIEDTLSMAATLVDEGKVGEFGVSNFSAWQICQIQQVAAQVGLPAPRLSQQMYNLVARRLDEEYAEFATTSGLETVIYNPLAGGLLTGRYRFESDATVGRFATARGAKEYRDRYWHEDLFEAVEKLHGIADQAGLGLPELAMRWCVSRTVVDAVLLGGSSEKHLHGNLTAIEEGPLPDDILAACDEVAAELRGPMPAYNR
ncbi:aldo/keto reductase [Paramicrobacterium humi]|nr:aldo/keto reductase [Microbacterium humi]